LTAGTVRRMMGPFSGRRVKAGRTCGRGRACPENNGGSDVYGERWSILKEENEMSRTDMRPIPRGNPDLLNNEKGEPCNPPS